MDRNVDDVRARQGWRGRPVLAILVFSMALAALAFLAYAIWAFQTMPDMDAADGTPAVNSPANEGNPLPTQGAD